METLLDISLLNVRSRNRQTNIAIHNRVYAAWDRNRGNVVVDCQSSSFLFKCSDVFSLSQLNAVEIFVHGLYSQNMAREQKNMRNIWSLQRFLKVKAYWCLNGFLQTRHLQRVIMNRLFVHCWLACRLQNFTPFHAWSFLFFFLFSCLF